MDKVNHLLERDKVLKAIEKSLKCPICLGTLTSPLVMCCNNHCVCSSCGKDLTECPTCRTEMANNVKYPIILDNILYEIPRKCELSEYCKEVMPGPELKEHKTICPYRLISCEIVSCSWKGEFKTLLEHVKINHKDFLLENGKNTATFTDFSIDKPYYSVKIIIFEDSLFWMYTKNDQTKGKYKVIFNYIPLDKREFESQIEFVTKDVRFLKKKKVLSQDFDIEETFSKCDILSLPSEELVPFIDDKKQLMYEINIFEIIQKIELNTIIATKLPENKNEFSPLYTFKRTDAQPLCQFCLKNTFISPIKMCANYHSFCDNCKVTKCPICNNSAMVSLFKIEHKCRLSDECKVYHDDKDALVKHEKICKYRSVPCLATGCSKLIQISDLTHHTRNCHKMFREFPKDNIVEYNSFYLNDSINRTICLESSGCIFWLVLKNDIKKSKLFIFFICFPLVDNVPMYSKIKFSNPSSEDEHTYTQPVFGENADIEEIITSENCMVIPSKDLSPYIDSENKLKCYIKLFKKNL